MRVLYLTEATCRVSLDELQLNERIGMNCSRRMAGSLVAVAVGASVLLGSHDSKAGAGNNIVITRIDTYPGTGSNGTVVLTTNVQLNNSAQPACANSNLTRLAFDASTAEGKARLALATSAFLAGRSVAVVGNGTSCINITNTVAQTGAPATGGVEILVQLAML
jgi:hypothetical protein